MATVRPFRAIRPAGEYAARVISLPYDVMNRKEAAQMAEGNPYSFLHICRSEIDLPDQEDPYNRSVYEKAKENIGKNLREGVFIQEDKPAIYIYREIMDGRVQTGIVGCVSVDEYQNNTIKINMNSQGLRRSRTESITSMYAIRIPSLCFSLTGTMVR